MMSICHLCLRQDAENKGSLLSAPMTLEWKTLYHPLIKFSPPSLDACSHFIPALLWGCYQGFSSIAIRPRRFERKMLPAHMSEAWLTTCCFLTIPKAGACDQTTAKPPARVSKKTGLGSCKLLIVFSSREITGK